MIPVLMPGDEVFLQREGKPEINDLVCFKNPQDHTLVVHRVAWLGKQFFISRGDQQLVPDTAMPYHAILGRVTKIVPGNKIPPFESAEYHKWISFLRWIFLKIKLMILFFKLIEGIVFRQNGQDQQNLISP